MAFGVSLPTHVFEVAPIIRVRPVGVARTDPDPSALLAQLQAANAGARASLQQERANALAELKDAPDAAGNTNRFRGLDRDQLASMVYDRSGTFSLSERRGAQSQLEANDRVYLDRAKELADVSGDERVLLHAVLELEQSKSPIERALPATEKAPSIIELKEQIAEKTAEFGGGPVGISLRYPNGLVGEGGLPMPASLGTSAVSPGATRVALLYRESLF